MSEQDDIAGHDAALHAQLRLFCHLMLGSADAADRVIRQIYQENWPAERVQLFRIAAELCGVCRRGRNRYCCGPGDDTGDE